MSSGGRPSFALNGNDLGFCFFSLKSQELTSQVARQLWEFDNNDSHAIDAVQAHVAELEKGSVFVAYNHLQQDVYLIYVVQDDTLNHYLLTLKPEKKRLELVESRLSQILQFEIEGNNFKLGLIFFWSHF
ncbi:uncharacterized protein [Physcomitrium patens]|uniref:uncharacterized protein n=1 Tax=Physcomitrium patens TaxID=3218 RepID=UPI003CCCF5EB